MNQWSVIVVCFSMVLALSASLDAGLIATEGFEAYSIGAGLDSQAGGGGAWTGPWSAADNVTVVAGGLSYANGQVRIDGGSQALQVTFDAQEDITDGLHSRGIAETTETVYMSLLFRDTVNDDQDTATGELVEGSNDFIQWGLDDGTTNPKTSVMRRNTTFQARATTTSGNSGDSGNKPVEGGRVAVGLQGREDGWREL
jgi:hypothetical protein